MNRHTLLASTAALFGTLAIGATPAAAQQVCEVNGTSTTSGTAPGRALWRAAKVRSPMASTRRRSARMPTLRPPAPRWTIMSRSAPTAIRPGPTRPQSAPCPTPPALGLPRSAGRPMRPPPTPRRSVTAPRQPRRGRARWAASRPPMGSTAPQSVICPRPGRSPIRSRWAPIPPRRPTTRSRSATGR